MRGSLAQVLASTDITTFSDTPPPPGESPWVAGLAPMKEVTLCAYDESWPVCFQELAALIRSVLGQRVLALDHVGSTAVPGLEAKPVIDIDLTVADVSDEPAYVPALEDHGFRLAVREPWWYGHRLLRHFEPACNLHVWSPDCPESARHLIFRDWLGAHPDERQLYAEAKRAALRHTTSAEGNVEDYNAHKQAVIREIYGRAFNALGLI